MKLIFIIVAVLGTCTVAAQNELPTGKIEVVKDFEVRLTETKKIRIVPQPLVRDTSVRVYEYKLIAPSPSIEYVVPELKPLAIEPEQKPTYYPLFAKAGYGSPNSLLGMFSYDHLQNSEFDWGFDFRHLSANNKKIPLQKFSDSQGRINGSYLINESILLDVYLDGRFENLYFYGADEIPTNPDALKRKFNRFDLNVGLSNSPVENVAFRYNALLQYLFDKDDLGTRERSFRLGGEAYSLIGEQEYPIGLKLVADLTRLRDNEEKNLHNIIAEPFIRFHTGNLKINVGGIVLLKTNQNEILPSLEVAYNILPLVSLRVGWQGEIVKNNFHSLSLYNPYINTRLDSIGNTISRRIFGGISGISGIFHYDITGGYTKFTGMPFFLQDVEKNEQFKALYDNGSYIGLEASVYFGILKHVTLRGNAFGRFYSLDTEEKPWHRPSFGIDAQASYTGGEDIYHVSLIFHGENGLPYRTPGGTETKLDPLLDLNIHGDYYFTESLGGFVELNNILGNKRERWISYPSFGFNAKAGVMLRL